MRDHLFSSHVRFWKLLSIFVSVLLLIITITKFSSVYLLPEQLAGADLSEVSGQLVSYQNNDADLKSQPWEITQNLPVLNLDKGKKSQNTPTFYQTTDAFRQYQPKYTVVTPHESNYGDRFSRDANGNPVSNIPIVVLHETVGSAQSAINLFRVNHPNDNQQVSYHALIALDGTVTYLVPPGKRAFGAGNSEFRSDRGVETVKTNPNLPSSVNNFAYHVSLETPTDGRGKNQNRRSHSGYSEIQYKSLAWLIAQSNIPDDRITTHREVDRAGYKIDPRSFDFAKFFKILNSYRQPVVS